jgi:hypothetical protein
VRQALVDGRLAVSPAILSLNGADSLQLRGAASQTPFRVLSPIATAVQSDRPTLRWTPLAANATYIVTLRDETAGTTVASPSIQAGEWTPATPLTRGDTYVWQVAGSADGHETMAPQPPAAAARFLVLNADDAERLARAPASHLVRGILYASAGLLDDAEGEFSALRSQNPSSVIAQRLADQLAQARRSTPLENR